MRESARAMPRLTKRPPRCIAIAGPNGAGKTTFARRYLPEDAGVIRFVNADLIAGGLSPLDPRLAALQAGRLTLREVDRARRLTGSLVPGLCRTQIGCARIVPWWAWERGWQALQVVNL